MTFGNRLTSIRKERKVSQSDLGIKAGVHANLIGRYERDEMKPSIEVARNIAKYIGTTLGYLSGETDDMDLFKDPAMLKRLNELNSLSDPDRDGILYALDGLLRDAKARKAYAHS